jgi:transcriptional antiterminator RfaH
MENAKCEETRWYVIHTHAKQEDRAMMNLSNLKIEIFAPRFRERRYNEFNGKPTHLVKYLFPRYIFARFKLDDDYHKIRFTRGVYGLVTFSDGPAVVEDEIIEIIQSRVGLEGFVGMNEDLKPGDQVVILEGRFKNLTGVFESVADSTERIRILLQTINYQAHAVVDRDLVRKIG